MGSLIGRALAALTVRQEDTVAPFTTSAALAGVIPPARATHAGDPRTLIAVYRAVQVLTTAAAQMPITVERGGQRMSNPPQLVTDPDPRMPASAWVTHMVTSMALTGNAYALAERPDPLGAPVALRPLNPATVFLTLDPATRRPRFSVEGREVPASDILHAHLQPAVPGEPVGLGPIQAARAELDAAALTRDFTSQWFTGTGEPAGILASPSATYAEAVATRNAWNGLDENGQPLPTTANPSRVKVLPNGFTYTPLHISPKDAQWIEARDFDTVQVARLFGIPSSLMSANPSGGSMTYANVSDEWLQFTRFTLMAYLRPLEDALSAFTVRGQRVRFNLDALLRASTADRYNAHKTALEAGFLTIDEVRDLEGLSPLTPQPATQEEAPHE